MTLSIDRDGGTITIRRSNRLKTATRGPEKRMITSILVVDAANRFPIEVDTLGGPAATATNDRTVVPIQNTGPVVVFPASSDSPTTLSESLML